MSPRRAPVIAALISGLIFGGFAGAQSRTIVNQGKPGNEGCWPVCINAAIPVVIADGGFQATIIPTNPDGGTPLDVNVAKWLGSTAPTVGQKVMDDSVPVVLPSDQVVTVKNEVGDALDVEGTVSTTPQICTTNVQTVVTVGAVAANVPAAQLVGRRYVVICNSAENTPVRILKCRVDGVAPVIGTTEIGDVLRSGDCIPYMIASGVVPQCIASMANTAATTYECL